MGKPIVSVYNDGKGKWQSYEATVKVSFDDRNIYISPPMDFEQTDYGDTEEASLITLRNNLEYQIGKLRECVVEINNRIAEINIPEK